MSTEDYPTGADEMAAESERRIRRMLEEHDRARRQA
jgi:hypothetical protein